jgi:hypothetical protein
LHEESTFPYYIDTPPPFTSVSEPDFEHFQTSSRPRSYCQKTQLPDPVKDFTKKCPRHGHFRHLENDVSGMPDHLGSDLDELIDCKPKQITEAELGCQ